ncbi:MAG TPA: hypothetical protein PLQ56_12250 [Aggregatilineales bacterium]|nr:hypothetical protein [Aggregatilineales bacterium]
MQRPITGCSIHKGCLDWQPETTQNQTSVQHIASIHHPFVGGGIFVLERLFEQHIASVSY